MKKPQKPSTAKARATKSGKESASGRTASRRRPANSTANALKGTPAPRAKTTKTEQCLALLTAADGATIDELMVATAWQAHSVRGFLAGTIKKKLGMVLESKKAEDGVRRYFVVKSEACQR